MVEKDSDGGMKLQSIRICKKCPHKERKHYAKNMCINCYHRRGRTKKAWACPHNDRLHYSKGLCQNCYLAKYYRNRKAAKTRRPAKKAGSHTTEQNSDISEDDNSPSRTSEDMNSPESNMEVQD